MNTAAQIAGVVRLPESVLANMASCESSSHFHDIQHDYPLAVKFLEKELEDMLTKEVNTALRLLLRLIQYQTERKKFIDALDSLEKYSEAFSTVSNIHKGTVLKLKAFIYENLSRKTEAIEMHFGALDSFFPSISQINRYGECARLNAGDTYFSLGAMYETSGKLREARNSYEKCLNLKSHPHNNGLTYCDFDMFYVIVMRLSHIEQRLGNHDVSMGKMMYFYKTILKDRNSAACYPRIRSTDIRSFDRRFRKALISKRKSFTAHKQCSHCKVKASQLANPKLFKCGNCRTFVYCSKDCQRINWRIHRSFCVYFDSSKKKKKKKKKRKK